MEADRKHAKQRNEVDKMPRWTQEARKKQSEIQRTRQSWKYSTGPKTIAGKERSRMNAWKHGLDSNSSLEFRRALRQHGKFLTLLNALITAEKRTKRNN